MLPKIYVYVKEPPKSSCQEQELERAKFGMAAVPPRVLEGRIVLEKTAELWEPIHAGFDGRSDVINSSGNEYAR